MDLTQDILSRVLGMGNLPYSPTYSNGGTTYQAVYRNNAQGEAGQGQEGGLDQIIGYDPNNTAVGQSYNMYDPGGKFTGQGQFKKVKDGDLLATGLLSAALMHWGLPMLQGAGGAAGAAGAAAAPGELGASLASIEGAGGLAPTLGAEAAGGIGSFAAPGLDVAAGLAGTAPEFAGMSGFAGLGSAGGFGGASLLPAMAAGAPAAGNSLLESLGGAKGLLGAGATVAGGLLGAKGQQSDQSATKKLDSRMDPYVYGENGVLAQANKLMQQQLAQGGLNDLQRMGLQTQQNWLQSPEYSQGFNQMKNLGLGLLSRGVASNPFAK